MGSNLDTIVETTDSKSVFSRAADTYQSNRMFNINANVVAASVISIPIASFAAKYVERLQHSPALISVETAVADSLAFLPFFVGLHYMANKKEFHAESFSPKAFAKDIGHVYATGIPSIAAFYTVAPTVQYWLQNGRVPHVAEFSSFSAQAATWISYFSTLALSQLVQTGIGLKTGLFKKKDSEAFPAA